jgi:hypothetical protein
VQRDNQDARFHPDCRATGRVGEAQDGELFVGNAAEALRCIPWRIPANSAHDEFHTDWITP